MDKAIVVKIGGSTLGSHDTTLEDLVTLQKRGVPVTVVHGGGKVITEWLSKQGVTTRAVKGERVTDGPTLDVVTAVLAGLVNKQLVADINCRGGLAIGLSGADGNLVQGRQKNRELGYVGEVTGINIKLLNTLLAEGYMPVISTVGIADATQQSWNKLSGDRHNLLNVNADTVAGDIAAVLGAERLIFLTDVPGIQDMQGKLVPHLSPEEGRSLIDCGAASGGMIPKIIACIHALEGAGMARIIDGRNAHALLSELEGNYEGTTMQRLSGVN